MSEQRVTRSAAAAQLHQAAGEPEGRAASQRGEGEDDVASVVPSQKSRVSTRSARQASQIRLQCATEDAELRKQLNDIQRSIKIAEVELEVKIEELDEANFELGELEVNSEEYKALTKRLKVLKKEEKAAAKTLRLLKVDETFKTLDIENRKTVVSATEKLANVLEYVESNHSQDLSEEEEEDNGTVFFQAESDNSDDSETLKQLQQRLQKLRETPSPPPIVPLVPVVPPPEEIKPPGGNETSTAVDQLAQVLSEALGKVKTSSNNDNSKMLARQALRTEMSPFDGNPAEWPVFIQQFHTVSKACGLTDAENLQRLQRSLKGPARECVQALLMSPDNVTEILRSLEERFGNAKLVVQRLVEQAQALHIIKEGDHGGFLHFVDVVRNLATTATTMKCTPFLANPQLITQVVKKLPLVLQLQWADYEQNLEKPFADLTDVAQWLQKTSRSIMRLYEAEPSSSSKKTIPMAKPPRPQMSFAAVNTEKKKEKKCSYCKATNHHLSKCLEYKELPCDDRWKFIRLQRLCFACLNFGHSLTECRSKKPYDVRSCGKPHHRTLHEDDVEERSDAYIPSAPLETLGHTVARGHINLNILPVTLRGPQGKIETFAMLDPGATITVVDASVAERLGLKGPVRPLTHSGLHAPTTVQDSRTVSLTVQGKSKESYDLENVRTVPQLSLPKQSVKQKTLQRWTHLKRLPITFFENARPTILIGQDNARLSNTSELVVGAPNAPIAGKSLLGWVLMGRVDAAQEQSCFYHFREETEDDLHQLVKWHFSTEAFGVKPNVEKPRSKEDARATQIMNTTLTRVGDRMQCGLLWRTDDPQLPKSSKETALKRLMSMERKMDASEDFATTYIEKISTYVDKKYARKLTKAEIKTDNPKCYYLPHFMAVNPKKGNKLRFVFDAASKTSGRSLNDFLLPGPDQVKPLPTVLFKFREKQIGLTADVRDMFHRIRVQPDDAVAQRFLWRGMDRNREPDVYQMDVLIFGATCSPAIAQEAKNKNARMFQEEHPDAVKTIITNMYVDDLQDSHDDVEGAYQRFQELNKIMSYGNLHLFGWLSNSAELMAKIPVTMRADKFKSMELTDGETTERVLGLFWKPKEDFFTFSLTFLKTKEDLIKGERVPAKRELLALVASIYDPLGLISLFTVRGKMMLQDAWRSKIGWNDEIPSSVHGKWTNWREGLLKIPEFAVKRCYSAAFSTRNVVTLHIFADASEQAYGAIAYVVVKGPQEIEVALVSSRARVAPLKPLSIPRLELMAAVLAARLSKFIRDEHTVSFHRTVYWSDSRTVLCWLNGDGRKFQQFVAHRVGEVQELTNPQEWRWIPTKLNVADEMTRDVDPCDWSQDSRWINGPSFLREEEDKWPMEKPQESTEEGTEELKPEFSGAITSAPIAPALQAEEFSSWSRLIRITARLQRLVKLAKKVNPAVQLSVQDLLDAEELWWRKVQEECYAEEKHCVINNKPLPINSKVRHLNLWLDESGVLRLDGRLKNAKIDEGVKSPVLLEPKHPYTKLLLQNYHDKGGHNGQERMVNEVRQKFHIPQLRAAVKSSWNSCQHCKNMRARPLPPLMGQLPSYRLEVGVHPFTNAGVDYFGPLEVTVGRRHEKRWGVLITCLSTRAVHLEIAASLSTDSCIMAIRRLVGRRGCPKHLYSDNGTNFHGANNEMKRALMELDEEKLKSTCAEKGIGWHFNPPSAPHMGGCWERLVKSVKVALLATIREQAPKEEVLQTLFVEAEHSVNSHPLTHVSIDPEDPEALTPNHFLIGRSSNVAPPGLFHHGDSCSKRVWRKAQRLADSFWQRWVKEYLPTLQRRKKWLARTKPVEVGDVAVEVNPQQPRGKWTMGRVTAVFPGADGIVRVVDWKTASGTYRRPVAKLAFLDVRRSEEAPKMSND